MQEIELANRKTDLSQEEMVKKGEFISKSFQEYTS